MAENGRITRVYGIEVTATDVDGDKASTTCHVVVVPGNDYREKESKDKNRRLLKESPKDEKATGSGTDLKKRSLKKGKSSKKNGKGKKGKSPTAPTVPTAPAPNGKGKGKSPKGPIAPAPNGKGKGKAPTPTPVNLNLQNELALSSVNLFVIGRLSHDWDTSLNTNRVVPPITPSPIPSGKGKGKSKKRQRNLVSIDNGGDVVFYDVE